jgi:hypothetical protein
VLATGAMHSYFGHDEWAPVAPGLKTIEDATDIRRRLLLAFERAEVTEDAAERRRLLTFVVVGAGPTGVELAGAAANPWGEGATTLEWQVSSPPPFHTFEELPHVRSSSASPRPHCILHPDPRSRYGVSPKRLPGGAPQEDPSCRTCSTTPLQMVCRARRKSAS